MENASKALIIAGAILIAIVLITFGVIILGQGSEVINNSSMSEAEISTFNSKFQQFEGKKVRGSKVNTMLNTVLQNNLSQEDEAKKVTVNKGEGGDAHTKKIYLKKTDTELNDDKADTGKVYEVKCEYSDEGTGLVTNITVTETNT